MAGSSSRRPRTRGTRMPDTTLQPAPAEQAAAVPAPTRSRPSRRRTGRAVWLLLAAALVLRLLYVAATPGYALVHDAIDYDRHAVSIANGNGYTTSLGRPTAFRPPAYPYLLAATYVVTGTQDAPKEERIVVARVAQAVLGTVIVALIGLLAARLWTRRVAFVAMGLSAVYVPLILIGGAVMSEPLFVALMLGALLAALEHRRSPHRYRWAVLAGVLTGLAILTRANAAVLLLPLAWAVWDGRPRFGVRALAPAAALVAVAVLTVLPWTVRNAVVLGEAVPVSTQLGSALAGTYNDEARADTEQPASWRALKHLEEYDSLYSQRRELSEPELERRLRGASVAYIRDHPAYVLKVGYWNTVRTLDLAGLEWSRHTAGTISAGPRWADAGVVSVWLLAALALAGALTRAARRAPGFVWLVPVLLFLGTVFLVVETPRYRTGVEPFLLLLAALAVTEGWTRWRRG